MDAFGNPPGNNNDRRRSSHHRSSHVRKSAAQTRRATPALATCLLFDSSQRRGSLIALFIRNRGYRRLFWPSSQNPLLVEVWLAAERNALSHKRDEAHGPSRGERRKQIENSCGINEDEQKLGEATGEGHRIIMPFLLCRVARQLWGEDGGCW